ncbi:hypothetical protein [Leptospira interrogans]|uniref:Uncharacterized protein n=1 Tax=Leptospira interrogans serovar Bataviae TaxID=312175 RepID=A0AAP9WQH5_LEPIR|nr:hypothetical protein [Leptospira interrogans]QOI53294.1 hypothetical protein Lepto1489_23385 [Leptospira interrogans serovar Bataviae]
MENFLKSGHPFELEIGQKLESLGFNVFREVEYLRESEGEIKPFTSDLIATFEYGKHRFTLFVECKYSSEDIPWVFVPDLSNMGALAARQHSFFSSYGHGQLDQDKSWKIHLQLIKEFGPFASQGFELRAKKTEDFLIKKAIYQSAFPNFYHRILGYFGSNFRTSKYYSQFTYHNISIIMTSSKLFCLNQNMFLDNVKQANTIADISEEVDSVILNVPFSFEFRNYLSWLIGNIDDKENQQKEIFQIQRYIFPFPFSLLVIGESDHGNTLKNLKSFLYKVRNCYLKQFK